MLEFNEKDIEEAIIRKVRLDGLFLENCSSKIKSNKKIVLEAVNQNGYALKWASNELKKDTQVILSAINNNGKALKWIDDCDKTSIICLKAIENDNRAFCYIPENLKMDEIFLQDCFQKINNSFEMIQFLVEDDCNVFFSNSNKNYIYSKFLDYLEKTNFSLDYRIEILRKMNIDELENFFKECYENEDYDLGPLDNSKKLEK